MIDPKEPRQRTTEEAVMHILAGGEFCEYCGEPAEGNFAIHRDGMDDGPEVPLCDGCGEGQLPTTEQIWSVISTKPPYVSRNNLDPFVVWEDDDPDFLEPDEYDELYK